MLISLNWIRDFVDLPDDVDPRALAERLTLTTAEVEGVERIALEAHGLVAARVRSVEDLPGTRNLRSAELDLGDGRTAVTVTAAPSLRVGCGAVYAPPGASIRGRGEIGTAEVSGHRSEGMILPGEELGIAMGEQEVVFLPPSAKPGEPLEPSQFDDWIIEIDNKSITHRPDLWGHYGVAREIAAICRLPLKPYPGVDVEELTKGSAAVIPISIEDSRACPRYSGLLIEGVASEAGPLWMQLRLGHVGLRPIDALVDLTNYIMAELGQPMHAFDAATVDRIEVAAARPGEVFTTLDGVERKMPDGALMIQCGGRSVAIAGVMGGLDTEVTSETRTLLLESANFGGATIRRCATALGLRTDASARFEKSLDPANTVLAIRRFVALGREQFKDMRLASRLSDCFPSPPKPTTIRLAPRHVSRTVGRDVSNDEIKRLLEPLEFRVTDRHDFLELEVPTFRATRDVTIEADVVEEIARYIGYDAIDPVMPATTLRRFQPHALHELEQRTLEHFTSRDRFHEIHRYVWYDTAKLEHLAIDPGPCVRLRNPMAAGQHLLRRSLMPNLLETLSLNRFHWAELKLLELGSVFEPADEGDREFRHVALISARRQKKGEDDLYREMKGGVESWAWARLMRPVAFAAPADESFKAWEDPLKTCDLIIEGKPVGRISVLPQKLRRRLDEHLASWSVVWAEFQLDDLAALPPLTESLGAIPPYPLIEIDFSFLVPGASPYAEVSNQLSRFSHSLLKRISFVDAYEGASVGENQRSLTIRAVIGDGSRTLVDADTEDFRTRLEGHLRKCGYHIRT